MTSAKIATKINSTMTTRAPIASLFLKKRRAASRHRLEDGRTSLSCDGFTAEARETVGLAEVLIFLLRIARCVIAFHVSRFAYWSPVTEALRAGQRRCRGYRLADR